MPDRRPAACYDPREHVRDELTARGLTLRSLMPYVYDWYVSQQPISGRNAVRLGVQFNTSPEFWLNLDAAWQRHKEQCDGE